jgi:hypothetical protein
MPLIQDDDGGRLEIRGRGFVYYYNAQGRGYQVNSEMVASDEYDIAINASDVELIAEGTQVTGPEKDEVISRVRKLCEKGKVRIRVFE